jgi:hypothetical protein
MEQPVPNDDWRAQGQARMKTFVQIAKGLGVEPTDPAGALVCFTINRKDGQTESYDLVDVLAAIVQRDQVKICPDCYGQREESEHG